jgi:hypothetical protein
LTGNSPRAHRFRRPVGLLAGWTSMARSQRTVADKSFERCSASRIAFHAFDNRCSGRVGCGFFTLIEAWSRADDMRLIIPIGGAEATDW